MSATTSSPAPLPDTEFVMVGLYNDPAEAQMARSAVEGAGMYGFLQGENANSLVPLAFRTRLLVASTDEAAARAVLRVAESTPPSEAAVTEAEIADEAARR